MNRWEARRPWRRTIDILASGRLVAYGATVVGTGLASFGMVGKMGRVVGSRVRLSVNREKGKWDKSEETERERQGVHGGPGEAVEHESGRFKGSVS